MTTPSNIIACVWDFDNVLISSDLRSLVIDKMELSRTPFEHELALLAQIYAERGIDIPFNSIFLNHLISYAEKGAIYNLNKQSLKGIGQSLDFYEGIARLLSDLTNIALEDSEFSGNQIAVQHYIVAESLAEIIRNSSIAHLFSGILASELVDTLLPPSFESKLITLPENATYKSVGRVIDIYGKVGLLQKMNLSRMQYVANEKKKNKVQAKNVISKFIYIGSGLNALPCFDWVQKNEGKSFSVYNSSKPQEFEEGDFLQKSGQVDSYGPADYTAGSNTALWLKMHVRKMCEETMEELEKVKA